ncbi:MAG: phosphatidylserine decarboxylase family protein, partial [Burkholderiaceae bacterium]|nr:phosphatidylserine decarboxylase family protein [Burkholderiaceae bacterium]
MYPHPIIAKEGWLYLVVIGVVAFIVHRYAGFFWSWPLWLFFFFTLQF